VQSAFVSDEEVENVTAFLRQNAGGNVYDEIDIKKDDEGSIIIGFNCKFLLDAIRVCDDGEIKMSYNNPLTGVLIEPQSTEEGKFKYFVMPIRMNN
jgi:DNA polymerase-3 subunit beta